MRKFLFTIIIFLSFLSTSSADELRPAYLKLEEKSTNEFSVLLKTPIHSGRLSRVALEFSNECKKVSKTDVEFIGKTYLSRWDIECKESITGSTIGINGLKESDTDLLLHIELLDNSSYTAVITPSTQQYSVPNKASSLEVVSTYTVLGIEHILEGFDHLLFVLALLLIAKSIRQLIWTITAFTLAHSITLAGVTFGYLHLPGPPVEAIIALSIVFLAMEVIHQKRGIEGIASRFPWIVAFSFGLLHGFGFAGALAEIGLPQDSVPLALLFFNVGVEIGQLMFVTVVLVLGYILKKFIQPLLMERAKMVVVYAIGSMASFWLVERVSGF